MERDEWGTGIGLCQQSARGEMSYPRREWPHCWRRQDVIPLGAAKPMLPLLPPPEHMQQCQEKSIVTSRKLGGGSTFSIL